MCRKESITPKEFYMIHFPGKEKPWDFDRYNYLRLFVSMLVRGKFDRLIYKTFI